MKNEYLLSSPLDTAAGKMAVGRLRFMTRMGKDLWPGGLWFFGEEYEVPTVDIRWVSTKLRLRMRLCQ